MSTKTIISLFVVGFFWGTTFLGIKIGVETVPPWFVAGLRQFLAALILLPLLVFKNNLKWIGWRNFRIQITLSLLMLIGANGLTTVAEEHLTSSLTSLISALSPILIFVFSMLLGMEKFTLKSFLGLSMGFSGVVFIFWDSIQDLMNPNFRSGLLVLILGLSSWGIGTIYTKKLQIKNENLFLNLFYQFAFAGIMQLIFAFLFSKSIHPETWSTQSILAIVYLAVFGSVITFFAYHYLLKTLLPTQVSILSYVNTIISIFLSWLILNEKISIKFIMASVLIISGVFIINYKPGMLGKMRKKSITP